MRPKFTIQDTQSVDSTVRIILTYMLVQFDSFHFTLGYQSVTYYMLRVVMSLSYHLCRSVGMRDHV